MAFEEGTERITCKTCETQHKVRWSRLPVRETERLWCLQCEGILYEGKTTREYGMPQLDE